MQIGTGLAITRRPSPISGGAAPSVNLDLNFAAGTYKRDNTSYGAATSVPGFTFSRAGAGTAVSTTGAVSNFASGVPKITNQGLLIEGAATNLITASNTFTTGWSPGGTSTLTPTAGAPDGGNYQLLTNTSGGTVETAMEFAASMATNTTYTVSGWFKKGTAPYAYIWNLGVNPFNPGGGVWIDMNAGTLAAVGAQITSSGIIAYSNGWIYVWMTGTTGGSFAANRIDFGAADAPSTFSVANGETVGFWGAQLEQASTPHSLIPTTTATVSCPADALTQAFTGAPTLETVTYQPSGSATVNNPTSPINLGSSSGGAWVGTYIKEVTVQ